MRVRTGLMVKCSSPEIFWWLSSRRRIETTHLSQLHVCLKTRWFRLLASQPAVDLEFHLPVPHGDTLHQSDAEHQ